MENTPTTTKKGGRYKLKYRGAKCLNCGHPLNMSDKYCPNCSQANSTKKLTLKDFFEEFLSSIISYDSRLLKTLSSFLLHPGRITNDYIQGKRIWYTNPFRFLLSLAIIYFLMMGLTGNFEKFDRPRATADRLFDLNRNLENLDFGSEQEKKQVLKTLDSLNIPTLIQNETKKRDSLIMADSQKYYHNIKEGSFMERYLNKQEFFNTLMKKNTVYRFEDAMKTYGIEESLENRLAFNTAKIRQRPGSFLGHVISKLPFAVFFFLPVFALFIWVAYIRKRYSYTDHLIFSFHNTSLLFILLIISFLIDSALAVDSGWIFLTIFSVYLFQAMRNFYKQNVFKTIVKYIFLNGIFFILAWFAILALLAGNVFTY